MKNLIILSFILALSIPACSQSDISCLDGKSPEVLIARLGEPISRGAGDRDGVLRYDRFDAVVENVVRDEKPVWTLTSFRTDSTAFRFLSDLYPEGIGVGARLGDLYRFDFVGSRPGRDLPGNAIRFVSAGESGYQVYSRKANYVLFEQNPRFYAFFVEDGVITEWAMLTKSSFVQ